MHPILFEIGGFKIYSYGTLILLGIILAFLYLRKHGAAIGLNQDRIVNLLLIIILAAYIGGRIFFYLEDPTYYFSDLSRLLESPGSGFVFYGSMLAVIPAAWWYLRREKIPVGKAFDLIAIGGVMVHGFGKTGCLMAGCCHGKVCDPRWGMSFHNPKSLAEPLNTPLYPTQLMDMVLIFSALAIMFYLRKRVKYDGQLLVFYAIYYGIGRMLTEVFRGDEARGYIIEPWLSHSQFISIIIVGIVFFLHLRWLKAAKQGS